MSRVSSQLMYSFMDMNGCTAEKVGYVAERFAWMDSNLNLPSGEDKLRFQNSVSAHIFSRIHHSASFPVWHDKF